MPSLVNCHMWYDFVLQSIFT